MACTSAFGARRMFHTRVNISQSTVAGCALMVAKPAPKVARQVRVVTELSSPQRADVDRTCLGRRINQGQDRIGISVRATCRPTDVFPTTSARPPLTKAPTRRASVETAIE